MHFVVQKANPRVLAGKPRVEEISQSTTTATILRATSPSGVRIPFERAFRLACRAHLLSRRSNQNEQRCTDSSTESSLKTKA
jgi:hypothetical protein